MYNAFAQVYKVVPHFYSSQVLTLVKFLVNDAHGMYPVLAGLHGRLYRRVVYLCRLQLKQAGYHFQIIFTR
jgi:hypothetical protein